MGALTKLGSYLPVDMTDHPEVIMSYTDAVLAIRHADRLATLLSVQSHFIKNANHLKFALLEHTFTQLLPLPLPVNHPSKDNCIWSQSVCYHDQHDLLVTLERLAEHFAAAALSLTHTPSLDAVRIVVPAAMAAIGDAILRQEPTDVDSSLVSVYLKYFTMGGAELLAAQSAVLPCQTPEVNVARTAVVDYFAAQASLTKIFTWEDGSYVGFGTESYMANICRSLAYPADQPSLGAYETSRPNLLIKNHPEFACLRNLSFFYKFFLNPEKTAFPLRKEYSQKDAELSFAVGGLTGGLTVDKEQARLHKKWKTPTVEVVAFGKPLRAHVTPTVAGGVVSAPKHRFLPGASASTHAFPESVVTEDDVLHLWTLPSFAGVSLEAGAIGAAGLSPADAELMLSYLTVNYLRIPLVANFFASDDRVHTLQSRKLQDIFTAVLFEPGQHLSTSDQGAVPIDVPTSAPQLLASAQHLLINELRCSPKIVCDAILCLARQSVLLDTGTASASTSSVILYIARTCASFDSYLTMILDFGNAWFDSPPRLDPATARDIDVSAETRDYIEGVQKALRTIMWDRMLPIIFAWYTRLANECQDDSGRNTSNAAIDENTRTMANLHGHVLVLLRNARGGDINTERVSAIVAALVFLQSRKTWNVAPVSDALIKPSTFMIPEHVIFDAAHMLRRRIITWVHSSRDSKSPDVTQASIDSVGNAAVRVSSTSGSIVPNGNDALHRWALVSGSRHVGHLAAIGLRSANDLGGEGTVGVVKIGGAHEIVLDIQVWQLTLNSSHPQVLPDAVAKDADVTAAFGESPRQGILDVRAARCTSYRLVGSAHTLSRWENISEEEGGASKRTQELTMHREYYAPELAPGEKAWLPAIVEPFRERYAAPDWEIFMSDQTLPDDAEIALLSVRIPPATGCCLELVVYRTRRMMHVYALESFGRRFNRSLGAHSAARIEG